MKAPKPHQTSKQWKIFLIVVGIVSIVATASVAAISRQNITKLNKENERLTSSQETDSALNSFQETTEQPKQETPSQPSAVQPAPSVDCAEQNRTQQSILDQAQQDLYYETYLSAKQLNQSASHIPTAVVEATIFAAYTTYNNDLSAQESNSRAILVELNCTSTTSVTHLPL